MRALARTLIFIFPLSFAGLTAAEASGQQSSLVIIFKDGRQQSFSMADIARIEFRTDENPPSTGRGNFMGKWRVGNGAGGNFYITLDASGEAKKSIGSPHGTWVVVNGEARINWDDGWHDAIRKVGKQYEKFAFSPEKSFTDAPSNVTKAENLEPQAN